MNIQFNENAKPEDECRPTPYNGQLVYHVPNPKYFKEQEFVDRETYEYYRKNGWDVWRLFNPGLLWSIDHLREFVGVPFLLNNWHVGGDVEWRGFRTPRCPFYSQWSQHPKGDAVDFVPLGRKIDYIIEMMIKDPWNPIWAYITRIEISSKLNPINHIHMDCANHNKHEDGIKTFWS